MILLPLNPPPPHKQRSDGCPLEFLLKGPQTEWRWFWMRLIQNPNSFASRKFMWWWHGWITIRDHKTTGLSGTPVRVFLALYNRYYRPMFFMYRKVSRYAPPRRWVGASQDYVGSTLLVSQLKLPSRSLGVPQLSQLYFRKSRFKTPLSYWILAAQNRESNDSQNRWLGIASTKMSVK